MVGRKDENGPQGDGINEDVSFTLNATDKHAVAYGIDRSAFNQGQNAKYSFAVETEKQPTMVARGPGAVAQTVYSSSKSSHHTIIEENLANTLMASDFKDPPTVSEEPFYIVRRLTPTECAKLNPHTDSAEYKMWGNGVALPCVCFVINRIKQQFDNEEGIEMNEVHNT